MIETESFGFIKKPFTQEKINRILDDVFHHMKAQHSKYFCSFNGIINIIDLYDISYIYSDHRKIYFHNSKTNEELCCYKKMDELIEELKDLCPLFERINQSYLVNVYKVTYASQTVVGLGDIELSLTENYRFSFHKKILAARKLYI